MFEKEAEEWVRKEFPFLDVEHTNLEKSITEYRAYKDGAKFGYNKANEWHYPSKGEYPKESKKYYIYSEEWGVEVKKVFCRGRLF